MHHDTKHESTIVRPAFASLATRHGHLHTTRLATCTALVGLSLAWLAGSPAAAQPQCPCQPPAPKLALKGATAAFEGRATERADGERMVTFAVVRSWKGVDSEQVRVQVPESGEACGASIALGQTYLVYASGSMGALEIAPCSRTQPITEAEADLSVLGAGVVPVEPAPQNGRPVLPETMTAPKGQGGCAGCAVGARQDRWTWPALLLATIPWMRASRRRRRAPSVRCGRDT